MKRIFQNLILFPLLIGPSYAVNENIEPRICSEDAKTHQNIVVSNEAIAALDQMMVDRLYQVKASLQLSPPKRPSTTGWTEEKLKELEDFITAEINKQKDKFIAEVAKTALSFANDFHAATAKLTPNIGFKGGYSYEEDEKATGTWSGLAAEPLGICTATGRAGLSVDIMGAAGFGIEVLIPARFDAQLHGTVDFQNPTGTTPTVYQPANTPSVSLSTDGTWVLTVGGTVQLQAGLALTIGGDLTARFPNGTTRATLDAGKGHLLFPLKKEVVYSPVCQ